MSSSENIKIKFTEKLEVILLQCNDRSNIFTKERYENIICEVKAAQNNRNDGRPLSAKERRRLKRFDILNIGGTEKLIEKKTSEDTNIRYFCTIDELFSIIHAAHVDTGHKRLRGKVQNIFYK